MMRVKKQWEIDEDNDMELWAINKQLFTPIWFAEHDIISSVFIMLIGCSKKGFMQGFNK